MTLKLLRQMILRLTLLIFTLVFFFSCQKQGSVYEAPRGNQPVNKENKTKDLTAVAAYLNISDLGNKSKGGITVTGYKYFSKNERDELWIISLEPGSYGFARAKIAANLKDGKFSMIIASYSYDTSLYKRGDFSTYTGITSVYDQKLKKLEDFVYEKGKLKKVKTPYCSTCSMIAPDPPTPDYNYINWCVVYPPLCNYSGGGGTTDPNAPILLMLTPDYTGGWSGGGGGGGGNGSSSNYDPNQPFNDINVPIDGTDEPIIDNGIVVEDISLLPPAGGTPRLIAKTQNRGNTEDLQYGTTGDITGILTSETTKTNDELFDGMSNLFYWCTYFDNDLRNVGNIMIDKFKANTSTNNFFENLVLNQKVLESNAIVNFLKKFGNDLRNKITMANRDINSITTLDLDYRPIFNGLYNKFHGLQILINDTEYTEIQLDDFSINSTTGQWYADVTVTVFDHFGLDKHDALTYQNNHSGFADWWLLQQTRGFVPFQTKVIVRKRVSGHS